MRCVRCTYENEVGATRCAVCGTALAVLGSTSADVADARPAGDTAPSPATPPPQLAGVGASEEAADLRATGARLRAYRTAADRAPRAAGFVTRLVAFAIDDLVLTAFAAPLGAAGFVGVRVGLLLTGKPAPPDAEEALEWLVAVGWTVMAAAYFTALHAGPGQTIGKAIVGIRVRSTDDAAIGVGRSLTRTLGYVASSACFGLGFLLIALTPSKRALHDRLAGTCVLRVGAVDE